MIEYRYFGAAFLRADEYAVGIPLFINTSSNAVFSIQVDGKFVITEFIRINTSSFITVYLDDGDRPYRTGHRFSFMPFYVDGGIALCDILNDDDVDLFKSRYSHVPSILLNIVRARKDDIGRMAGLVGDVGRLLDFSSAEISDFRTSEILIYQSELDMGAKPAAEDPPSVDQEFLRSLRALDKDGLLKLLISNCSSDLFYWGYMFDIYVAKFPVNEELANAGLTYLAVLQNGDFIIDALDKFIFKEIIYYYANSDNTTIKESLKQDIFDVIDLLEKDDKLGVICDGNPTIALAAMNIIRDRYNDVDVLVGCLLLIASRRLANLSLDRRNTTSWIQEIKQYMQSIVSSIDTMEELRALNYDLDEFISPDGIRRPVSPTILTDKLLLREYIINRIARMRH